MDTQIIFNSIIVAIVLGIFYVLIRRYQAKDPDVDMTVWEYGNLLGQAYETAKIFVQGIQEAWRTGEIADDEREDDAVEKLVELYPQLSEDELRRLVKSAVYGLRQSAGKQVDKVMEQIPEPHRLVVEDSGGLKFTGGEGLHKRDGSGL